MFKNRTKFELKKLYFYLNLSKCSDFVRDSKIRFKEPLKNVQKLQKSMFHLWTSSYTYFA